MSKIYTVLGMCLLAAVFAGFYKLRLDSTIAGTISPEESALPEEPAPQDELTRDFHDKDVSPVDYAAQVNAREMTDAAPYSHELTLEVLRLRAAAEEGESLSQGRLGQMYHDGRGVERDLRKAFYWFRLGAEKGDRNSLLYLGRYYMGEFPELGINRNLDRAEELLRPVAEAGDMQAMALLGAVLQEKVRAGEKDREQEAAWWYNRGTGGEWDETYSPPVREKAREEQAMPEGDGGDASAVPVMDDGNIPQQYP